MCPKAHIDVSLCAKGSSLKNFFINIICGFIPDKSRRTKVRWILRLGLINCIRIKRREPKLKFPYKLAILAIAKNEAPYFREWIEYHRLVGVEKFYIYDNESTDDTKKVLASYIKSGLVEYIYWPGEGQQTKAYMDCFKRRKFETRWLAVIDLDEFLVPVADKTIPEYLAKIPSNVSSISVGWAMYGSNGHIKKPKGMVMENYKRRAPECASYKSIVNPRFVVKAMIHYQMLLGGKELNERDAPISSWRIRCNHYYCKSWEEYRAKMSRGAACKGMVWGKKIYHKKAFDERDRNEVLDPIMDKFIKLLRAGDSEVL
jgi:hypothetical protein